MVNVHIPHALRMYTENQSVVMAQGKNVREVIADLERQWPGIRDRILGGDGLRPGLAVVIDGTAASLGLLQPVPEGAELHFLPAIAGG